MDLQKLKMVLITLFWKQNEHHQHGVLVHTLRVTLEVIKAGHYRMFMAGLLHDIGKPLVAFQKDEDIPKKEYSFTDHEEKSYQVIKDWKFISEYTKNLVRYHYIIRRMKKSKEKGLAEYPQLKKEWDSLSPHMQREIGKFMHCDDLGKGNKKHREKRK